MSKFTQREKWNWLKTGTIPEEALKVSPTLHFCTDWDFLCIEHGDPEWYHCGCDEIKALVKEESDATL